MLEAGAMPSGAGAKPAVIEGSDQTFMAEVIEASRDAAIIVDFWAPWCGPCKQLGPALEAAVARTGGRARLVKIDVDKHQMVAGQLRVQSIPAVFAFVNGQPVDGFMGALPASEVQAFVDRVAAMGPGGDPIAEALEAAEEMLKQGAAADAAEVFAAVLGEQPDNTAAMGGLARAYLALGDVDRAKATLDGCPAPKAHEAPIVAARAALDLAAAAAEAGETVELRAKLAADPGDHQARFDLATALLAAKDPEGAIDELLELFRRDREWNEGAAKAQLVKIFDSLGPKDPLVAKGRRRLSSMIFA
jgi:putative thioredoxin